MKQLFFTVGMILASTTFAQKINQKDVPSIITEAFVKAYPQVNDVDWNKEGNQFEASFDINKTDYSVLIDEKGNISETEIEIKISELPEKVKSYLAEHYKNMKIKEVAKITDTKGVIKYEVEIKGKDLIFDANGNFIK